MAAVTITCLRAAVWQHPLHWRTVPGHLAPAHLAAAAMLCPAVSQALPAICKGATSHDLLLVAGLVLPQDDLMQDSCCKMACCHLGMQAVPGTSRVQTTGQAVKLCLVAVHMTCF